VMDYVANSKPLCYLIRRFGAQPELARELLPGLAKGLEEMHSKGFVHRDFWSENVLVDSDLKVKIIDLGCASNYVSGAAVENRMNVPYMSPQASNNERQQTGDDSWTLGLLLTEVVTGRFVADVMRCHNMPFHAQPHNLAAQIKLTYEIGGKELGDIAAGLLCLDARRRTTMTGVVGNLLRVPARRHLLDSRIAASIAENRSPSKESPRRVKQVDGNDIAGMSRPSSSSLTSTATATGGVSEGPEGCSSDPDYSPVNGLGNRNDLGMISRWGHSDAISDSRRASNQQQPHWLRSGLGPGDRGMLDAFPSLATPAADIRNLTRPAQSAQRRSSFEGSAGQQQVSATPTTSTYSYAVGEDVIYSARTFNCQYHATVLSCTTGCGCLVQVTGGDQKFIPHADMWRLQRRGLTQP